MTRAIKDPTPQASTGGDPITGADYNALIDDYLSQTDKTAQVINSLLKLNNGRGMNILQTLLATNAGIAGVPDYIIIGSPANANNIQDPLVKFVDSNSNGLWDTDEPLIYDADSSGTYSVGDTVILGVAPAIGTVLHTADPAIFEDDASFFGVWTAGDPIFYDLNGTTFYESVNDLPISGIVRVGNRMNVGSFAQPNSAYVLDIAGTAHISGSAASGGLVVNSSSPNNFTCVILGPPAPGVVPGTGNSFGYLSTDAGTQLNIGGGAGVNLYGFKFSPITSNTPGAFTTPLLAAIWLQGSFATWAVGSILTDHDGVLVDFAGAAGGGFSGGLTVTTTRGFHAKSLAVVTAGITYNTVVGLDVDAIATGTTKIGIRQSGINDTNRFAGKMRIGNTVAPITTLDVRGGFSVGVTATTTTYTALSTDYLITCDATAAAYTVTLPPATNTGQMLTIVKKDASVNAVTVSRAGADTIEGATTKTLALQYDKINLIADGTGVWYDVGKGVI